MSQGVDKLILLAKKISDHYLKLAREHGDTRFGYKHVLDLSKAENGLPIILHCDGLKTGIHKVEVVGVARLGLARTREILTFILEDVSRARIYRIDFCTDLLGVPVWELATVCSIPRVQNYRIYRQRGAVSFYLRNSEFKTVVLYNKAKELRAKGNPRAGMLRKTDELTRIEVQLTKDAVPFQNIRDLPRYADIDLLTHVQFRQLASVREQAKPLHVLAAAYLSDQIGSYGLQAVKKRFSPSTWAYFDRTFFEPAHMKSLPDIRARMKKSISDWLGDRIRSPRFIEKIKDLNSSPLSVSD